MTVVERRRKKSPAPSRNITQIKMRLGGSQLNTPTKSGKPMKLQKACTMQGAAKWPVLTNSRAEYVPKSVVYANWKSDTRNDSMTS